MLITAHYQGDTMKKPYYANRPHKYGEWTLDINNPPKGATGLIINEWLTKSTHHRLFKNNLYFIFRNISGSYDYHTRRGEPRCGAYTAKLGYWWFNTEKERDEYYEWLLTTGRFNIHRSK